MRVRRLKTIFVWGFLAVVASLAGGLAFAFYYAIDGENVARAVTAILPKYLPGSNVGMGKARLRPFAGHLRLNHIFVHQVIDGKPFLTAKIPWLEVHANPKDLIKGRFEAQRLSTLHSRR